MKTANQIVSDVIAAMQSAEEIGGPEGAEYVRLMVAIADHAKARVLAYQASCGIVRERARLILRGERMSPAYEILSGDCEGSVFYAYPDDQALRTLDLGAEVTVQFHPDDQFARAAVLP